MSVNRKYLAVILILAFLFLGCEKIEIPFITKKHAKEKPSSPEVHGKVVAKINNMAITQEDLDRYVENYNRQIDAWKAQYPNEDIPKKIETTREKIDILKNVLVRQRLLYQEATDRGLDRKPEIVSATEDFKTGLLISELAAQEQDKIQISQADIENYYNTNKAFLKETEERRVLEIVTRSEPDARSAYIDVLKGENFKDVAARYSVASNAQKGGDLGFIKFATDRNPTKLEDEAFTLDVGGISRIFKGEDNNYYLIKVEEKKGGRQFSLSEVKDKIKNKLETDKQKEVFDNLVGRLQRDSKIDILEDEVK